MGNLQEYREILVQNPLVFFDPFILMSVFGAQIELILDSNALLEVFDLVRLVLGSITFTPLLLFLTCR